MHDLSGEAGAWEEIDGTRLRLHPARPPQPIPSPPAHGWDRVDGNPWMQRHDIAGGSVLRLTGLADFRIDVAGVEVEAWPVPGVDAGTCRQLYLNNVLPMALSRQGKLVLHASAMEADAGAIVFVGVSGRGKSTLASAFARAGHALLVDDGLVLEAREGRFMAMPGDPSIRLRRDSGDWLDADGMLPAEPLGYTDKQRIHAGGALRFASDPCPVHTVFLLGDDPNAPLAIQPLLPAQAMMELIHYSFLLDVGERRCHAELMRQAAALVACCGVYRLDYQRDYARLAEVRDAVHAHAARLPIPAAAS
jgi:hypothetical protein